MAIWAEVLSEASYAAAVCAVVLVASVAAGNLASAHVEMTRTSAPGVGATDQGVRIDPTTGIVYAVGYGGHGGRLYAIEDGVVIGEVALPFHAAAFDIDPTTQRAYIVTDNPSYTLRVVDLVSLTLSAQSVSLPGWSRDIDADPVTGRVAVTVFDSPSVIVLDGATLSQLANVPLSDHPFRLAFAKGADKLYVTRLEASTLALSGVGYATIESLPSSHGEYLVLDHDADVLYVSSQQGGANGGLFKIDVSTNTLSAHNPSPPWGQSANGGITLTDGGGRLIGLGRHGLTEIDTSSLTEVGLIGPAGLHSPYGDLDAGRLVALFEYDSVSELAPTVPPTVLPTAKSVASTVAEGDPIQDENGDYDLTTVTYVTVHLDAPSTEWVRASVEFTDGTATYPADHWISYAVDAHFAPGETEAQALLWLRADEVVEPVESLSFRVTEALGAAVDPTPATITVVDDDVALPVASITPVEPVGVESDGVLDFAIELDVASEDELTVDWSVSGGTATIGDDFDGTGGQAVFEPGETLVSQSVTLVDDVLVEGDETFSIELTGGPGVEADDEATATIVDDDEAPPPVPVASIQPVDPSALESDGSLEFFVELDVPSDDEVTVDWARRAGTAGASDFDDAGGTAVFARGRRR